MRLIRASRHDAVRAGSRPAQTRYAFARRRDETAAMISAWASLAGVGLAVLSALVLRA